MRVSDEDLHGLSQSGFGDLRMWLRLNQPRSNEGKMFWWENLIARALHIVYTSRHPTDRSQFATLAYGALLEEVDQGPRWQVEGAERIANLTAAYLNPVDSKDVIVVDAAVARNLDLIEISIDIAAEQAREWRNLPSDKTFALRDAKNLSP